MAGTSIASSGIVLEPLTKENYQNWSSLVKNYLIGEGLWRVVTSVSEDDSRTHKRKNAKALYIIQLTCGSENLSLIREIETAKDAWNRLSALYSPKLKAVSDIHQGEVEDSMQYYKVLHRYVENGDWNDARRFINEDREAIYSSSSSGRTVLHVAVIAGHEHIVEYLVKEGREKLVKMQDNDGYTALALAADLTGNTNIARYMVEKSRGGRELLTMATKEGEIPVLLAAAKAHKEITRYLLSRTPSHALFGKNSHYGVLLLTRCIFAEIFDVALSLVQQIPELPLAHESDDIRPLYALARMPSAFPSSSGFGLLQQFIYNCLRLERIEMKRQNSCGITIRIESDFSEKDGHRQKYPENISIPARLYGLALKFPPIKLFCRLLISAFLLLQNSILLKISGIREIYDQKVNHRLVDEILNCMCQRVYKYKESELREASAYDAMLQAAKHGIVEFMDAMRKANPELLWAIDKNMRGIFSHAILNRRLNVIKLMDGIQGRKEIIKCCTDTFGNNLLHLAGHVGPPSDLDSRSGPALQMQREIQWFKAVERIVHPKCKEAKNNNGKKPREIFSESHEDMVKAGEKWAKDTAKSFTLVGTLITTIMFAVAFTVPGGNNQTTGVPVFAGNKIFSVFIIADAMSLFTASTSVLIFIGVLTSRYAEKDFLTTLPLKLLFGLVTLFWSVVSMMIAFCASIAMMLNGYRVVIAAMSLGSIPVIVFVPSQLRLFLEIFISTISLN